MFYFNPRSREGNDLYGDALKPAAQEFQSTFPRGERLRDSDSVADGLKISIHVPARGTTTSNGVQTESKVISIHVPARGTTTRTV